MVMCSICLPTEQAKVKSAMADFQLPSSNIPSWAHNISEHEWKEELDRRLKK